MWEVRCPKCENKDTIVRAYVTYDYETVVGASDEGEVEFGELSHGDPNATGYECLSCGVPLLPHAFLRRAEVVVGHYKAPSGELFDVTEEMIRTCPDCGSENAYECPDPENWGALICWCDESHT